MTESAPENGLFKTPIVRNEPVLDYAAGSAVRAELEGVLAAMAKERPDLPMVIDGREVRTGILEVARMPHEHMHVLADAHLSGQEQVSAAVDAASRAWLDWSQRPWADRAAVFLRAADLLSGPWRSRLNAGTMLNQSKTVHQAEIDAAAEIIDFWRYNVEFMRTIYAQQPVGGTGAWTRVAYRPLEGLSTPSPRSTSPRLRETCRARRLSSVTRWSGNHRPPPSTARTSSCACLRRPDCRPG